MVPFAVKIDDTVHVFDPSQIRWFEYNDKYKDLTVYYNSGAMEIIKNKHSRKIFNDLQLHFNVVNVRDYDID